MSQIFTGPELFELRALVRAELASARLTADTYAVLADANPDVLCILRTRVALYDSAFLKLSSLWEAL